MSRFMVALLVFLLSNLALAQNSAFATLKLKVVNERGGEVKGWELRALVDEKGKDWKTALKADLTAALPPGDYTIRLESLTDFPYQGVIHVRRPSTLYVAGLTFAGMHNIPAYAEIKGRILSTPGKGDWCQLVGVYSDFKYTAEIADTGVFVFPNANAGTYVLTCRLGSSTVGTRLLEFSAEGLPEVIVDLSAPSR